MKGKLVHGLYILDGIVVEDSMNALDNFDKQYSGVKNQGTQAWLVYWNYAKK